MNRLSAPWGPASMRAMTRRSTFQLVAAQQHRVAGKAEDVADALALAPRHRLRPGVMAVAAHHDVDRRPAGTDMADDMAQHQGYLGAVRRLAGAQDDRHWLGG